MKGGFNKILRNIVAGSSDTEFEKRLTKATFQLDSKEPKEKHVIFLLESLNGEHKEQVSPIGALKFILERHISNLDNWAINMKVLIIIHRSLQNIRVNRKIIKDLKKNEHLLHPYQKKNPDNKYNIKMYMEISKAYSNYIKFYMNTCLKTDMLTKPRKKLSDEVRTLRTAEILRNYEFFEGMCTQIFSMFQHTNFCKQTRLFSNLIFMLLKDLMEIYRIYYNHITEILERFPTLNVTEVQKAFVMYQNFVNLTEAIKNKANKLIYIFNFPITLPDFYNPEKGLIDTLRVVVNAAKDDAAGAGQGLQEVSSKLRAGMNREQYSEKDQEMEAFYFDCNVLEKIEGQQDEDYVPQPEEINPAEELKMDKNLDIFEYITNLDIGGESSNQPKPAKPQSIPQQEERKEGASFDFDNFAAGGDGNPNNQVKRNSQQQPNDFFDFQGDAQNTRSQTELVQKRPQEASNQGSSLQNDLFDVFNNDPNQPQAATGNDLNDIFAGGSQPLATSQQPQIAQSKVDVLGSFYTQNQNPQPMGNQQVMGGNQFQTQALPGTDPFSAAEQNQQVQQQPGFQPNVGGGFQPMAGNPFGNQFNTGWGANPAQMQQMQQMQQQQQLQQQQQMMMQMQTQPQMQQNQQNTNQGNDFNFF